MLTKMINCNCKKTIADLAASALLVHELTDKLRDYDEDDLGFVNEAWAAHACIHKAMTHLKKIQEGIKKEITRTMIARHRSIS